MKDLVHPVTPRTPLMMCPNASVDVFSHTGCCWLYTKHDLDQQIWKTFHQKVRNPTLTQAYQNINFIQIFLVSFAEQVKWKKYILNVFSMGKPKMTWSTFNCVIFDLQDWKLLVETSSLFKTASLLAAVAPRVSASWSQMFEMCWSPPGGDGLLPLLGHRQARHWAGTGEAEEAAWV